MPTSSTTNVHCFSKMRAREFASNGGCFSLECHEGYTETFSVSFFTGDADLARALKKAINEVLLDHGRLHGDIAEITPLFRGGKDLG